MSIRIGDKIIAASLNTQVIPDATQLKKGIVRLATDTEIEEGTSNSVAVTPKQLANSASKTLVDDTTIVKDNEDKISTVGVKTKSGVIKYDWIGTIAEYEELEVNKQINPDWFYYITDDEGDVKDCDYGSDVALLDIIVTNQILEGKEKLGKELQGSLVLGLVYPEAYNKLLEQYNSGISTTETVSNVTIPYKKTINGWKIIDMDNKSLYDDIYEATGTANYFVIDTINKQFYLPKTDNFLQASTKEINKYNEAGLPNITGILGSTESTSWGKGFANSKLATGAFQPGVLQEKSNFAGATDKGDNTSGFSFDASRSSSIYGKSETVQPKSTNVYIYYKVGNTVSVKANIVEDLQANIPHSLFESKYSPVALDGLSWIKADGSFLSSTKYPDAYNELVKELETPTRNLPIKRSTDVYGDFDIVVNETEQTFRLPLLNGSEVLPSDKYDDLTLASGATYVAPANGYFSVRAYSNTETAFHSIDLFYGETEDFTTPFIRWQIATPTSNGGGLAPVKKGQIVCIVYSRIDLTNSSLRFIYGKGNGDLYYYLGETLKNTNVIDIVGLQNQVTEKANRNLDNTTRITNCITKVPRNKKYRINGTTLTLLAGSKFIVPYGTEDLSAQYKYNDNFISEYYKVVSTQYVDNKFFVIVENRNNISKDNLISDNQLYRLVGFHFEVDETYTVQNSSTTTDTSSIINTQWVYNPTTNKVLFVDNGTLKEGTYSLPLFYVVSDGTCINGCIADEFNCCGYIGTTIFLINGLEGLIANGYDDNGSIQNIKYIQPKIELLDVTDGQNNDTVLVFKSIDDDNLIFYNSTDVYYQTVKPDSDYFVWFNTNEGKWYVNNGTTTQHNLLHICTYTKSAGKITKFTTRKEYKFGSYYDPQRSTLVLGA